MRILFLTQVLPYPPDAGPKFKTWQVIRYLVDHGHQVTLISMVRADELPYCPVVRQQVAAFYPIPIRRSRIKDGYYLLRSFASGQPFLIERDDQRAIRLLIDRLVAEQPFDAIHADQLTMTQFALPYANGKSSNEGCGRQNHPLLLFDAHNATWKILERFALESGGLKRLFFKLEADRIRRYEAGIVAQFDRILSVSALDRSALLEAACQDGQPPDGMAEKFEVIPITVDTREIRPAKRDGSSLNIFTMGTLHYPPNVEGIRWFVQEVFPAIRAAVPGVTLTIVGKNPPPEFVTLQNERPDVYRVPGYVADLTPWFEGAAIMVVPVRVGGGMRVRILEAFAREMPLVTTTIGLEGIDASAGEHLLIADDAPAFAAAVVRLLGDAELQRRLARNGRALVEQVYDRQVVLKKFDQIYPIDGGG